MPSWLKCVACVVVWKQDTKGIEVLLGKRQEEAVEGGKWALLGGTRGIDRATDPYGFARIEAEYDVDGITCARGELKFFDHRVRIEEDALILKIYFLCEARVEACISTRGDGDRPTEVAWFTLSEVRRLLGAKEFAFKDPDADVIEQFFAAQSGRVAS